MEFQFPANPSVGDIVVNPNTGTSYTWTDKCRWTLGTTSSQNISVYEGPIMPAATSEYVLWFDTSTETLKYYYCETGTTCEWVSTAFDEASSQQLQQTVSQLTNVIIELQTKVNNLENSAFILME